MTTQEARDAERDAIVAWLERTGTEMAKMAQAVGLHEGAGVSTAIETFANAADAVRNNAHRKAKP